VHTVTIWRLSQLATRGRAPELEICLRALRAGLLWDVDTGNDGDDAVVEAEDEEAALWEVAEHARERDSARHPEGRVAWAFARGWTATRIDKLT
jgi:hypothetical protein